MMRARGRQAPFVPDGSWAAGRGSQSHRGADRKLAGGHAVQDAVLVAARGVRYCRRLLLAQAAAALRRRGVQRQ